MALSVLAAVTLLPAILAVARTDASTRCAVAAEASRRRAGLLARRRRAGDGPPGRSSWSHLALLVAARAAIPARRVRRAGRLDPAADVQSRQGFDQLRTAFGEGEISPILIAVDGAGFDLRSATASTH